MVQVFPLRQRVLPSFPECLPTNAGQQEQALETQQAVHCIDHIKKFINMEIYSLSMAILTIWSIFAIDIQKSFVGQSSAYIFGYVHVVCIVIFLVDLVFSWICREEYKLSFYFWIDVISTMSMVMEITWVDNFLTDNSNVPGVLTIAKVVKASRLSRIGGRAAKIILMFLAYSKNKREEEEKLKKEVRTTESAAGESNCHRTMSAVGTKIKQDVPCMQEEEDDEVDIQVVNQLANKVEIKKMELDPIAEEGLTQKSSFCQQVQQIAYHKSKDTVLAPFFSKRKSQIVPRNSQIIIGKKRKDKAKCFDTTNLIQRMEQTFKLEPLVRPNVDPQAASELQKKWKELCERQQQALKKQKQKIKSNKQNSKLGQILKQRIQQNIIIMIMSLIIILPLISADTWFNKDPTIDQLIDNYFSMVDTMNATAVNKVLIDIVDSAQEGTFPVLDLRYGNWSYPGNLMGDLNSFPPLDDFMRAELIEAMGGNYALTFNGRGISQINAIINIARSCFITILLIFSTIIFMYSIQTNALIPLEKMSIAINKISINPFDALKEGGDDSIDAVEESHNQLETNVLEEVVKKMTKILALGAGEVGSSLISTGDQSAVSETGCNQMPGTKIHGIFLCVKLSHFQSLCQSKEVLTILNQLTTYSHDIVMQNGGTIMETDLPNLLFFWPTPEDIIVEQETTKYYMAGNPFKNLGKTIQTQKTVHIVLRSFLQINIALDEINRKWCQQNKNEEELWQRFYIRAGVHIGDGYQGSIGDLLKIKVKCIGRDVRFARSLCELSEQYKVSNIVSEEVCAIMDDLPQAHLRKIDYVRPKTEEELSFWICTYDFTLSKISENEMAGAKSNIRKKKRKIKKDRTFREKKERSLVYKNRTEILNKIKVDPIDVVLPFSRVEKKCLKPFNQKFYHTWNCALENYYSGQWDQASPLLQSINERFSFDYRQPISQMLMERICKRGGDPGQEWQKATEIQFQ